MQQPENMPAPPKVIPSDMARFLFREFWRAGPFSTSAFASHFELTIIEAHDMLNDFVAEGLLTFVTIESGMEMWHVTRDGRYVFAQRARRLRKDQVEMMKQAVISLAPVLIGLGALEVSLAGRPVVGKPNGALLVGIQLSHEPYSDPEDEVLQNMACEALLELVTEAPINVMLFHCAVPRRLARRLIMARAPSTIETAVPEVLDEYEAEYDGARAAFLQTKRCSDELISLFHAGMSAPLRSMFSNTAEDRHYPVTCRPSEVQLTWVEDVSPDSLDAENFLEWLEERDSSPVLALEVVARAEYFQAIGQFDKFCSELTNDDLRGFRWHYLSNRLEPAVVMEQAIRARRNRMRAARTAAQQIKAVKSPPTENSYYALFDTISGHTPVLAGFVRQPSTNSGNLKQFEKYWARAVPRPPGSAAAYLESKNFGDGWLLLDRRLATAAEISAFDKVGKRAKRSLKLLVIVRGQACSLLTRYSQHTLDLSELGPAPAVLLKAELGRPVQPRLCFKKLWTLEHTNVALFDVVRDAPPGIRQILNESLVAVDSVEMFDFARKASLTPCIDPVVLASGLTDAWTFTTQKNTWKAETGTERWSADFTGTEVALDITIRLDGVELRQRLAPHVDERYSAIPYSGYLSSLLSFMEQIQSLHAVDIDARWAAECERWSKDDNVHDIDLFSWFVGIFNSMLHGFGWRISRYDVEYRLSWPYIQVESETSPDGQDTRT